MKRPSLASHLLREWRLAEHLTLAAAARLMGIDFVQLSKLELGRRRPGLDLALLIERVTGGKVSCPSWAQRAPRAAHARRSTSKADIEETEDDSGRSAGR